jgi:Cys-tRNA(Pro) deacylase
MNDAVARVQHFFTEQGLDIALIPFATRIHTAEQAAAALGVPIRHIVKSLVFEVDNQPVLVLCSGDRRVDTAKLAALCHAQQVHKASAAVTKRTTGYSIGGVPPVAHATALPVFMDTALLACDTVYAAAGTAQTLFAIAPEILKACSGARVASLSEE